MELNRSLGGMKVPFASNYDTKFIIVRKAHIATKKFFKIAAILWVGIRFAHFVFKAFYLCTYLHFQYVNKNVHTDTALCANISTTINLIVLLQFNE